MTSLRFFNISEQPAPELNPENTAFFQDHPCDFSILEMLTRDTANINVEKVVNPVKPDKRNSGFF